MLSVPSRRKTHVRSVSRFCDEANIGEEDEIDLAEFILAAHYLGTEANDEQLMETFMEMEDNLGNLTPKEVVKNVLAKVNDKYGLNTDIRSTTEIEKEEESKLNNNSNENDNVNDEIIKQATLDPFTQDLNWQNDQLGKLLNTTVQSSNTKIAQSLLETTALTAQQISDLTGLPLEKVEEMEEEFDTESEDEEEERPLKKSEIKKKLEEEKTTIKEINAEDFSKALAITKNGINNLDKIISSGKEFVEDYANESLELLKKFKIAINTEGEKDGKDNQNFKKLRTQLLSVQFTEKEQKKLSKTVEKVENEKKETHKWPKSYRVVIHPGALAKHSQDVKSKIAGKIEIGTIVTVEEIIGRRARISKPIKGWISVTSSQGKIILQKEGTKSKLMANARAKERARQTKILILKSVTTLNETTVERILIKSEWNLRRAIEAFYIAKFKTQEYLKVKEEQKKKQQQQQKQSKTNENNKNNKNNNLKPNENNKKNDSSNKKERKGFWKSWKNFTRKS